MYSNETQSQINRLEVEIDELSNVLLEKRALLSTLRNLDAGVNSKQTLSNFEINRFSRQIILPEIGVKGQLKLKNANVLIVGAGGLGCPAAIYLCGAGIGHIGIIDYDLVELNNLHRQIVHKEENISRAKVTSVKEHLLSLNSTIKVTALHEQLNVKNAMGIIKAYDVVLDATDNVATRYLLNDACVFAAKPLISGSALQLEGQLTVYNYRNGPCYRCLFPEPPPPETVTNCGDGGVIGAVTGVIGTLQALEAIKIIVGIGETLTGRLLLFDATTSIFRNIKLRGKFRNCDVCIEPRKLQTLINYEQFCGMRATDKDLQLELLPTHQRISVQGLNELRKCKKPHLLIDVRTKNEFEICKLANSLNCPIKMFIDDANEDRRNLVERIKLQKVPEVYVICRRGNDSQIAAQKLLNDLNKVKVKVNDVVGGLHAWSKEIDLNFPIY